MARMTYYGGPMDGGEVPVKMHSQDYVLITIGEHTNNPVTYYYVKCDECAYYEYSGEVEKDYE